MKTQHVRNILITLASLALLVLASACSGVANSSTGSTTTLTGTITKVDSAHHSVTLSVSGSSYTVTGLSDQEVQALQSQVGKTYTIQVTKQSDGTYVLNVGTGPTPAANQTPAVNGT